LKTITIIDYGAGNLLSVKRSFEFLESNVIVTSDPKTILKSDRLVFPGVGAFPKAMNSLKRLDLINPIIEMVQNQKPLLGLCLGMQLLFEQSEEFGITQGLGLIKGQVISIPNLNASRELIKIPHIGWKSLKSLNAGEDWSRTILSDVNHGEFTYFVHSYMAEPTDRSLILAEVIYEGVQIPAVIKKNNITGCQFHPEKSGVTGLKILKKFLDQ
jgi:glutamine amidotransferase